MKFDLLLERGLIYYWKTDLLFFLVFEKLTCPLAIFTENREFLQFNWEFRFNMILCIKYYSQSHTICLTRMIEIRFGKYNIYFRIRPTKELKSHNGSGIFSIINLIHKCCKSYAYSESSILESVIDLNLYKWFWLSRWSTNEVVATIRPSFITLNVFLCVFIQFLKLLLWWTSTNKGISNMNSDF